MDYDVQNLIKSCALWMRIFAMLTIVLQGLGLFYFLRYNQSILLALIVLLLGGLSTFLFYVGQIQDILEDAGIENGFKLGLDKEIQFWKFATIVGMVVIATICFVAKLWLRPEGF